MRVLLVILWLTLGALAAPSLQQAVEYGNYAEATRHLEGLIAKTAPPQKLVLQADLVVLLAAQQRWTDALKLGQTVALSPAASPSTRLRASMGLLMAAHAAHREELVRDLGRRVLTLAGTGQPLYAFAARAYLGQEGPPLRELPSTRPEGAVDVSRLVYFGAERLRWGLPGESEAVQAALGTIIDRPGTADALMGLLGLLLDFTEEAPPGPASEILTTLVREAPGPSATLDRLQARYFQLQGRREGQVAVLLKALSFQKDFRGVTDVRWDLLQLWLAQRPAGWELDCSRTIRDLLEENQRRGYRPGVIVALGYRGKLLAEQAQSAEAITTLQQAVVLIEQEVAQAGPSLREAYSPVFELLASLQAAGGDASAAWITAAQAGQLQTPLPPELARLSSQAQALEREVATGGGAAAQETLARTRAEYQTALARLRQENPRYEAALSIRPVNFSKQQGFLPADCALIEYLPTPDALYIFVATREKLAIQKVAIPSQELNRRVAAFREDILARTPARTSGAALYDVLVRPLGLQDARVLAFIPTDTLTQVPFAALSDGETYLGQRQRCVTLLRASDVEQLARPVAPGPVQVGAAAPLAQILTQKLEAVRLVLLPGDATALGSGQGEVRSLADAYSLAGAPAVAATLWAHPSAGEVGLVADLQARLARGEGRAEALQAAQVAALSGKVPYDWARFVLLGDWR